MRIEAKVEVLCLALPEPMQVPPGHSHAHADNSGLSPRVGRSSLIGFRRRCMGRLRVVRSFDEAGGGDSLDHASRVSGAPRSRVLLGHAAGQGVPPDRVE